MSCYELWVTILFISSVVIDIKYYPALAGADSIGDNVADMDKNITDLAA